ncbi:DUF2142 domain-containing protein [Salinibacterium sp. PAMC 21357]|uniref:DUF2142 domain-containing protein n=1 Tax=Salinibacterium sp. PAMC 21357 TaxID=1112215 RepID=UPI000475202F|nr:DUF2142 domain-containing protein [Salinibacterium sp. PAMC 21357]
MLNRRRSALSPSGGRIGAFLAPLLVFAALAAWALSSPVGSSPDDDFHLTSIWCATGDSEYCAPSGDSGTRLVPPAIADPACFAYDAEKSAGCQNRIDFAAGATQETARGNFAGGYPVVYYGAMSVFVGPDVNAAVLVMRLVNIALFVGLGIALCLLLPVNRRQIVIWQWALTTVPLGLFVLSSNNPSAWAIMGVGYGWLALLGFYESRGRRRVALGAIFLLSAVMASGSRSDATIYFVLAVFAAGILAFESTQRFWLSSLLPVASFSICALLFRSSRSVDVVTSGLTEQLSFGVLIRRFVLNLTEVPSLWTGVFGQSWGLGWLDTSMPSIVWVSALAALIGAGFVAARAASIRKVVVVALGAAALAAVPVMLLVLAGKDVGEDFQPRYLLPLVVVFVGAVFFTPRTQSVELSRTQVWVIVAALSGAQFVALHLSIRRYVTGIDALGPNLDAGREWWWSLLITPNIAWIVGSMCFAGALALLLPAHRKTDLAQSDVAATNQSAEQHGIRGL